MGTDASQTHLARRIGARLRLLRDRHDRTQEEVARVLGLNHRQSVGHIESGERRVSPEELVRLAAYFGVAVTRLTDRFEPDEKIAFSFRASSDDPEARTRFEEKAARWITMFIELEREQRIGTRFLRSVLGLSESSSYEDAQAAGEEVARELRLGDFPGTRLSQVLDGAAGVLLLHVSAPAGISGAAARVDPYGVILVNRADAPGRRNFDIAHELFHLLTWDRMPPPELEVVEPDDSPIHPGLRGNHRARMEQLADNFASALLMPASVVKELWNEHAARAEQATGDLVVRMANRFRVSAPAVAWRLHNLGLVERPKDLPPDAELARAARSASREAQPPPLFSHNFVDRVRVALEDGALSFRKAARILDLDSVGLEELFRSYGMSPPYEA